MVNLWVENEQFGWYGNIYLIKVSRKIKKMKKIRFIEIKIKNECL